MPSRIFVRVLLAAGLALLFASGGETQRLPITIPHRGIGSLPIAPTTQATLTASDVADIVRSAAREAQQLGIAAVIAVVDRDVNILAVFRMTGAPRRLSLSGKPGGSRPGFLHGLDGFTLAPSGDRGGSEVLNLGVNVPDATVLAALSKAGTAAIFQTAGNAFSTRTASFIIQEHFPPGIDFTAGGPLFGVQFSSLPCTDVKRTDPANGNIALPLGLSGDSGGLPLYQNGVPVGGIGVEADGFYTVDFDPADRDQSSEELVALAGTRGFEAPSDIRGDQIFVNGIRLPFANAEVPETAGGGDPAGDYLPGFAPRDALPSVFVPITVAGLPATADARFFPFTAGAEPGGLTAQEVERIIGQGLAQSYRTRAAIRRPLGSFAQVNVAVVDTRGRILGIARTPDAPVFGFDVSAQKARSAAFFSGAGAASALVAAGFSDYVSASREDGIALDGSVAFSDRATGFLSRPFFPDGINETENGPFSRPISQWSPFNNGLQVDLVRGALVEILTGVRSFSPPCTPIPAIAHGIQIFPGSVPLYKNGLLVGGVGISGDGVDQDDLVAAMASAGFEAPIELRSDRVFVRDVRLPWVKFPRHPNL